VQGPWRPRSVERVIRRPRPAEVQPIRIPSHLFRSRRPLLRQVLPWLPLLGILGLILLGFLLLLLPWANREGRVTPWSVALFTATSAVTVTGLVVRDTAEYWSPVGKGILAFLIFVGGTGFMTLGAFFLTLLGQRASLSFQVLLQEPLGRPRLGQIARLVRRIVVTFVLLQAVGFVLLWGLVYRPLFPGDVPAQVGYALFHAISAFNNAGFTIYPQSASLSALATLPPALLVFMGLIILGGLGFPVLEDLRAHGWRFRRYHLDTKLVLTSSLALWAVGAVMILLIEVDNPTTLGRYPLPHRFTNALFLSVSARTAGFSTFPLDRLDWSTLFLLLGLMFIGTASVSTGGGIRLNTLGVLVATAWAGVLGREQVRVFQRTLPHEAVHRAVAVAFLSLVLVFGLALLIAGVEGSLLAGSRFRFLDLLFEVVSAFGTVGLSTGVTPELNPVGQGALMLAMLVGRVGPLTLALALAGRRTLLTGHPTEEPLRYAEERVRIG